MTYKYHFIDTFIGERLRGNRACVVELEDWLPSDALQGIAVEIGLPETSFVVRRSNSDGSVPLRWFSKRAEVDLCGHGTLGAAHHIFSNTDQNKVSFSTRSGVLTAERLSEGTISVKFPRREIGKPVEGDAILDDVGRAVDAIPDSVWLGANLTAIYSDPSAVRSASFSHQIQPLLDRVGAFGLVLSARALDAEQTDFVTRFFTPAKGVPEDPVTGSIHCALAPFWGERLKKRSLIAHQLSSEGGRLICEVEEDHVVIGGRCCMA